jgi:hypothetical protein
MQFKSHIDGKNANVEIYADRVEWERPHGLSGTKISTGILTGGLSLLGTVLRSGRAGSEIIPIKAVSSVTTKRDGLMFTKVQLTCSGNTIDFRVQHKDAQLATALLTDLILGKHPAQQPVNQPAMSQDTSGSRGPTANPSVADELVKLANLRAAGVITDDEFTSQKHKLLDL